MSEDRNKKRKAALTKIQKDPNMISRMWDTMRLVIRLMGDKRVNFFLKLLPVFSLVYLINPMDAFIPVIDDALVMGLGTYMFIEFCPQDVVEEHRAQLAAQGEQAASARESSEVINSIFTESDKEDEE